MKNLILKFRENKLMGKIFHTLDFCLQQELKDCKSVLDIGCGPSSPIQHCKNIRYSVGVETFAPYLEQSKKKNIHTSYIEKNIEYLNFPDNSFDAVIMIEVIEHLTKTTGDKLLTRAERWAKKKIVLSTPNGFFSMGEVDSNIYQKHLSGWNVNALKSRKYKVHGLCGAKFIYKNQNAVQSIINQEDSMFINIRFKPKKMFYAINAILQLFTYYFPKKAFELFAVKNLEKKYD